MRRCRKFLRFAVQVVSVTTPIGAHPAPSPRLTTLPARDCSEASIHIGSHLNPKRFAPKRTEIEVERFDVNLGKDAIIKVLNVSQSLEWAHLPLSICLIIIAQSQMPSAPPDPSVARILLPLELGLSF